MARRPQFATLGLNPMPRASTAKLHDFAASNNAFALDLFAAMCRWQGNLVFSPFSIGAALATTLPGARGETAAEIRRVLHLDGAADEALDVAATLLASVRDPEGHVVLRVANRLFGDASYAFEAAYLDDAKAVFGAPLEALDFRHATDDSLRRINAWAAAETEGRIKDLVPPGGVGVDTRLVLANAIYFLGEWLTPFQERSTRPGPFHVAPAQKKSVPTMRQTDVFAYAATDGVQLLQMPYAGGALAMTLVLPGKVDGLDALEHRLSVSTFDAWVAALNSARRQRVVVALPRFEIDPPRSIPVSETLSSLGMRLAFDPKRADFTGIASPPRPEDRLYIDEVFHKAFVKVDEKGTEAAAATAVALALKSGFLIAPERLPEFRADHPFLFFLRAVRSGVILFLGRVADPAIR